MTAEAAGSLVIAALCAWRVATSIRVAVEDQYAHQPRVPCVAREVSAADIAALGLEADAAIGAAARVSELDVDEASIDPPR